MRMLYDIAKEYISPRDGYVDCVAVGLRIWFTKRILSRTEQHSRVSLYTFVRLILFS